MRLVRLLFFGFGLEVDFARFPFLGDLDGDAGHQAKQRGIVGEETDDAVRRLICEVSVSHMLEVRRRWRLASGKLKAVSPSGMFCSAQAVSLDALFRGF